MPRVSAGLLMYRLQSGKLEVLLVHPGGPFFAKKDDGAWTIPKGEPDAGEDLFDAAQREFKEETGFGSSPPFLELAPITQKGGKFVHAWAFAGDVDASQLRSNTFKLGWPPHSGKLREFPEMDRAGWFNLPAAKRKIKAAQIPLLDELRQKLSADK